MTRRKAFEFPPQLQLNRLFFGLRQFTRWQRGPYRETPETKAGFFMEKLLDEEIVTRYQLQDFRQRSGRLRYLENLTFLTYLEHFFAEQSLSSAKPLRWLDVGAKNWSYADALHHFIASKTDDFSLTGIELDGHRLYRDLHSRADYALGFTKHLPNTRYLLGDVLEHQERYEIISCFFPFVFEEPLLAWGLPPEHFKPEAFLGHLLKLLAPEGILLILNQGEDEAEEQKRLLGNFPVTVRDLGGMPKSFMPYQYAHHGFLVQNHG